MVISYSEQLSTKLERQTDAENLNLLEQKPHGKHVQGSKTSPIVINYLKLKVDKFES